MVGPWAYWGFERRHVDRWLSSPTGWSARRNIYSYKIPLGSIIPSKHEVHTDDTGNGGFPGRAWDRSWFSRWPSFASINPYSRTLNGVRRIGRLGMNRKRSTAWIRKDWWFNRTVRAREDIKRGPRLNETVEHGRRAVLCKRELCIWRERNRGQCTSLDTD